MSDLLSLFDDLEDVKPDPNESGESFSGIPLTESFAIHLAKDLESRPVVMFRLPSNSRKTQIPNTSLENLRVESGLLCRICDAKGRISSDRFTVIRCISSDRSLQEYFLRTLDGVVKTLSDPIDPQVAVRIVNSLAMLFQAVRHPPTGSVIGLWAELLTICSSVDPNTMVGAWHSELSERYDFSFEDERIEVKASGDGTRRHHFSLRQAYPPSGVNVNVVSIMVDHSTNGASLGDLWDEVHTLVQNDAELILKVERVCMQTLGETWHTSRQCQFDRYLAAQSIMIYDIKTIPKVSLEQPDGVTDVIFRSDLSRAILKSRDGSTESGELFRAFLP